MDARQNFYNHNLYLFRFLVGSTVAFVGVIMLLWWQERAEHSVEVAPRPTLRHFSTEAAMADVTRDYAFGARYIHDIEVYPELRKVFFEADVASKLSESTLAKRLSEVESVRSLATAFEQDHVYHTSYYIGNLLVLPDQPLHTLLLEQSVPKTALLIDTALADVRAGVVKLQQYYDVAPPSWYLTPGAGALFYPTPSFPSLTVSEAAIVFYLLATVDPTHARHYERSLSVFADQVWRTGVHFRLDIEYALRLAALYVEIMRGVPEYQVLISSALDEWGNQLGDGAEGGMTWSTSEFIAPDFPVPSQFAVSADALEEFAIDGTEPLVGQLHLTLTDTRLDPPLTRLYAYDLEGTSRVLPVALDLTKRQYPELNTAHGYAAYLSAQQYFFISGEMVAEPGQGSHQLASSSLFWRAGQTVKRVETPFSVAAQRLAVSRSGEEVLFSRESDQDAAGEVWRASLREGSSLPEKVAVGRSPSYHAEDAVIVVREGSVYRIDLKTSHESKVSGIPTLSERGFASYDEVQHTLLVADVTLDPTTLVPHSTVALYDLSDRGGEYDGDLLYMVRLTDAMVSSALLSPGGRYLALTVGEGEQQRQPRVLLFDIFNGIITKEIDLTPFAREPLRLDGWTLL